MREKGKIKMKYSIDKNYCMSSYLEFRTIADEDKIFYENVIPKKFDHEPPKFLVENSNDLELAIASQMKEWTADGKSALALSGGIDSAILAKYMPKGSMTYTFQCVVPGIEVQSEVEQAKRYAKECGLQNTVVEITWEDMERFAPILMKEKGCPIHSIEIQIYVAAMKCEEDGFANLIFGETSDINYGGFSSLLSKDWSFGEFVDRYSFVKPYYVLKNSEQIHEPYKKYLNNNILDVHEFLRGFFKFQALDSYVNPCKCAEVEFLSPYATTHLNEPLDIKRIRSGENKYIVREIFSKLYKDFLIPDKLPMPRATNEWFKDWIGPTREEFLENCVSNLTGDQKWQIYCLEQFLNMHEPK